MDWLTFVAILMALIPIQVMMLMCMRWSQNKINKYEVAAAVVFNSYVDSQDPRCANARGEVRKQEPTLLSAAADIYHGRDYYIDRGLKTAAAAIKDKYRDDNILRYVDSLNGGSGKIMHEIDNNPLLGMGFDIITSLWMRTRDKK